MFDHTHYVPILKGKEGEYTALRDLDPRIKAALTPLLEVVPLAEDVSEDPAVITGDATTHLETFVTKVKRHWGGERPAFVDLLLVQEAARLPDGTHPMQHVFDRARSEGLVLIPVTGIGRDPDYQAAVHTTVQADQRGLCIRLDPEDFEDLTALPTTLAALLTELGFDLSQGGLSAIAPSVDLLLDFREITASQVGLLSIAIEAILNTIPHITAWRTVTLAGCAFPQTLGALSPGSVTPLPRSEWAVWLGLYAKRAQLSRLPTYGDYGINHPDLLVLATRVPSFSANLRYTTATDFLVFKGHSVRKHPRRFKQFNDLCSLLIARAEFSGAGFSNGDKYVDACAAGTDGPGNATKWRYAGTSHHLTFVPHQIASLPWP